MIAFRKLLSAKLEYEVIEELEFIDSLSYIY